MRHFSTFEVAKILGLQRTRVHEWIISGYIFPTEKAKGKGTKALFSVDNLYFIQAFRKLTEMGFSRKLASRCVGLLNFRDEQMVINPGPTDADGKHILGIIINHTAIINEVDKKLVKVI